MKNRRNLTRISHHPVLPLRAQQPLGQNKNLWKGIILEDKSDEELFAQHRKQTERTMKIVVTLLAAVFLFVLYFLIKNG
jgi:hypothetical protein